MKKLSDYKDEEAIELWADLLEPMASIFSDQKIVEVLQDKTKSMMIKAKEMLKSHKEDVSQILLRIDDTPLDGLNVLTRLIALMNDFQRSDGASDFFESAEQERTDSVSFGSATENTGADEH